MTETFTPLVSSNLSGATYDRDAQTLDIEFTDGKTYRYFNVPESTYRGLTLDPSPGGFFYRHIRNRFGYEEH